MTQSSCLIRSVDSHYNKHVRYRAEDCATSRGVYFNKYHLVFEYVPIL